jgi:hypothetical protein
MVPIAKHIISELKRKLRPFPFFICHDLVAYEQGVKIKEFRSS